MKRTLWRVLLLAAVFCGVYLSCSFLIPGWRLKLDADPCTYFIATLGSMAPLKLGISLAVTAGSFLLLRMKKKR